MSIPVSSSPSDPSRLSSASEPLKAAETVKVAEAQSNGRKWKFFAAAVVCGVIAAVCIVGLAALMVPQVTAAVGLSAGALMATNLGLAVVTGVAFLGAALFLAWGAKPVSSPKAEEKPAEATSDESTVAPAADESTVAPAADESTVAPAADESTVAPVTPRVPSPADDMPGRADTVVDQL